MFVSERSEEYNKHKENFTAKIKNNLRTMYEGYLWVGRSDGTWTHDLLLPKQAL